MVPEEHNGLDLTAIAASDSEVLERVRALQAAAERFEAQHTPGLLASAESFAACLDDLSRLQTEANELECYVSFRVAATQDDQAALMLQQAVILEAEAYLASVSFVEQAWQDLAPALAEDWLASPLLAAQHGWLRARRRLLPHTLAAAEEEAFAVRQEPAASWLRLYDDRLASLAFADAARGAESTAVGLDETLALYESPSPRVRRAAGQRVMAAFSVEGELLARVYDALAADRFAEARLRGFASPWELALFSNDLEPEPVEQLLTIVSTNYELQQRLLALKARAQGQPLTVFDRALPLFPETRYSLAEAYQLVTEALSQHWPRLLPALPPLSHIDAGARPGKRPGAFALPASAKAGTFTTLSFGGGLRDVLSLAHEIGHCLHYQLSLESQTALVAPAPALLGEVAALALEQLVFDYLLESGKDEAATLARGLERNFDGLLRQASLTSFELSVYRLKESSGRLDGVGLAALWQEESQRFFGPEVSLPAEYGAVWASVPHFIREPFYTVLYPLASLIASRALAQADSAQRIEALLRSGGSLSVAAALAALGTPLADEQTVYGPLARWEQLLERLESFLLGV